jgi:hypothetical protein
MYRRPFFVTNSSSTHSMVWLNKLRKLNGPDWGDGEFGWQPFVLSLPKQKETYMAVMLYENFLKQMPHTQRDEERVRRQVNNIFGHKVLLINNPAGQFTYYIDHQSLITLPKVPNDRPQIHLGFFRDFCDYVINNPHVIILGGNDNTDTSPRPKDTVDDEIWEKVSGFGENAESVFAYHLDKPRKWKVIWREKVWSRKGEREAKFDTIIQFPEG